MASTRNRVAPIDTDTTFRNARVVVPYIRGMQRVSTLQAVGEQAPEFELFELSADEPTMYAEMVEHLWRIPRTYVNVEQDIVPPPVSIARLIQCEHVWCLHPYQVGGRISGPWLGLVKFAGRLLRQFPDVPRKAFYDRHTGKLDCRWQDVGRRLAGVLRAEAFEPHYHWPAARHLHEYSSGTV